MRILALCIIVAFALVTLAAAFRAGGWSEYEPSHAAKACERAGGTYVLDAQRRAVCIAARVIPLERP